MSAASFGDLFRTANACPPAAFSERVFWQCLYPRARLPARLIWSLNRHYFRPDVEFVEKGRNLANPAEVRLELKRFRYYHRPTGLLRRFLKMRLSGQRLLNLADQLFAERKPGEGIGPHFEPGRDLRL